MFNRRGFASLTPTRGIDCSLASRVATPARYTSSHPLAPIPAARFARIRFARDADFLFVAEFIAVRDRAYFYFKLILDSSLVN